jgi:3-methyl-2-oxobutanoate hydroxymethyltransferase
MSSGKPGDARRPSLRDFASKSAKGEKLVMVSAYDALFARLAEEAGVDAILVGDSLGNVILGLEGTVPVTLDHMIHHGSAVRRGARKTTVIVDMPFLTYQVSVDEALRNCGRVMQQTLANGVKLEGAGEETIRAVAAVVRAGIPVQGHIGFTPQAVHTLGGARVQGRSDTDAQRILDEARRLEDAGAFSVVLELMPSDLAERVSQALTIPTIGIGAGAGCDGQVLVLMDLLGLNDGFSPRFLKRYGELAGAVREAVSHFAAEVREGKYPGSEHSL